MRIEIIENQADESEEWFFAYAERKNALARAAGITPPPVREIQVPTMGFCGLVWSTIRVIEE